MSSLLPANATKYERALEKTCARSFSLPVLIDRIRNPCTCPVSVLPWLAYERSVDEWNEEWSEEQKRQVTADSIPLHKIKGTRGAVDLAVNSLGYNARIVEWWGQKPEGERGTFTLEIEVDDRGVTESVASSLLRVVNGAKNCRSHLDGFVVSGAVQQSIYASLCVVSGDEISIEPLTPADIETTHNVIIAGGVVFYETIGMGV